MNVGYDIDETLLDIFGQRIEPLYKELTKDYYNGCKIFLITARPNIPPIIELTKFQLRNIGLDKYVDIESCIYYTTLSSKVPLLCDLNIERFYDDCTENIIDIYNNRHSLNPDFKLFQVINKDNKYFIIPVIV